MGPPTTYAIYTVNRIVDFNKATQTEHNYVKCNILIDPRDAEAVKAQQVIQPLLHRVARGIADRLLQGDLVQRSRCPNTQTQ